MKKLEQRLRRALFMVPYLAKKGYAGALVSEAAAAIGTTPEELRDDVHRLKPWWACPTAIPAST